MTRFFGISLLMVASVIATGCGSSSSNCSNLIKAAVAAAPANVVDAKEQNLLTQECNNIIAPACTDAEFQMITSAISNGKNITASSFSVKCAQAGIQFLVNYAKAKVGQFVGSN